MSSPEVKITVEITSWLRLPRCRSVVFQRMRINWRIPLLTVTGPWSCSSSLICGYNPVFCLPFENVDGSGGLGGGLVFIKQWVKKKCCKISVKYDARRETNIWKGEQYVTSKNKGFGSAMTHGEYSQQHVLCVTLFREVTAMADRHAVVFGLLVINCRWPAYSTTKIIVPLTPYLAAKSLHPDSTLSGMQHSKTGTCWKHMFFWLPVHFCCMYLQMLWLFHSRL